MENINPDLVKKIAIVLCSIGVCVTVLFIVVFPYLNRGEGDPYFAFTEVPVNETFNSSIIHLEDKDFIDVRGLDVKEENGKIAVIIFRYSDTIPEMSIQDFNDKYGSRLSDPSSGKYLEYKGIYYYAVRLIP